MPCFSPLTAYRSSEVGKTGKRGIVFQRNASLSGVPMQLPCGQCIGCRLEKSRQWAMRCMHEKRMSSSAEFVTLTYADGKLPVGGTLVKRDLQLFMKRLRFKCGSGIRFYACGEYGESTMRPHYHLLLFNIHFADRKWIGNAKAGQKLYSSDLLGELWPDGHNWIGEVTFESCAYVARYIMKKVTGAPAADYYQVLVPETGELIDREPEFTVMSRRPGIGRGWFDQYHSETYANDSVIMNGMEVSPPRYYDNMFELLDFERMQVLRKSRRRRALLRRSDNTSSRLRVREVVEMRKMALFQRRVFL